MSCRKPHRGQEFIVSEGNFEYAGLQIEPVPLVQAEGQDDIALELTEHADGLHGALKANADILAPTTLARMAQRFLVLLEAIGSDVPNLLSQPIAELPLLTAAERHQLLVEWNDTETDAPKDKCIHELFEEQAAQTPDAVAVVFEDQQLTYAQLDARADQVAHHLQSLGVGPDMLVGICVDRSLEMIVGLFGILKAGGAYLPLDPAYPAQRLAYILEDAAPTVVVTQSTHRDLFTTAQQLVLLDNGYPFETSQPATPHRNPTAENLAYCIYTSGSTGLPKGVLLQHGGLCNLAKALVDAFGVTPGDRVLQVASLNFDAVHLRNCRGALCRRNAGCRTRRCSPARARPHPDLAALPHYTCHHRASRTCTA